MFWYLIFGMAFGGKDDSSKYQIPKQTPYCPPISAKTSTNSLNYMLYLRVMCPQQAYCSFLVRGGCTPLQPPLSRSPPNVSFLLSLPSYRVPYLSPTLPLTSLSPATRLPIYCFHIASKLVGKSLDTAIILCYTRGNE